MKPSRRINNINEYYFSKKLLEIKKIQTQGIDIINLGVGSPDLPPHPEVIKELANSSRESGNNMYQSYRGIEALRRAFSNWYKRIYNVNLNRKNEILPLIGSKEGIMHISMAFCNPGDRVLIPNPGYPAYTSVSNMLELDVQYYNLNEGNQWLPDFDELESLCNNRCKILWINYPHMPTGKVANIETLVKLAMWAKCKGILIVNDNPYSMVLNEKPLSILSNLRKYENILELNSLSKSHNMAGWRVGMVGGSKENINHILKVKSNFDSGMYKPVQLAATKALCLENSWYADLNIEYNKRRNIIWNLLDQLECSYNKEISGLFVWAKIPQEFHESYEYSDYLLHTLGIFAAPGSIFGSNGNHYIRFSLCAKRNTLKEALNRVNTLKEKILCE